MMEVSQKGPEVWYIKNIFSEDMFNDVVTEFFSEYSQWVFDKHQNSTDPIFGELMCTHDHTDNWSYSTNFQLIKSATIAKLKVQKILKRDLELCRVNTNIHFHGQDSAFHNDAEDSTIKIWTCVVFTEFDWDSTWGGHIEIQSGDDYITLPYIPNCAVLLNGHLEHRGLAPNRFAIHERKTLAFLWKEV